MAKSYTSDPIPFSIKQLEQEPVRIDLEFKRLDHSGASYEGRVFLNNPRATERTSLRSKSYAGSFYIFGHGGCFGDVGHCDISGEPSSYDNRPAHPLTPAFKRLDITAAIKALPKTRKDFTVTVVPVVTAATDKCDLENVLRFDKLTVITYD